MRSPSTVRTAVMLAVTENIVEIIAQADMCTPPACSVRRSRTSGNGGPHRPSERVISPYRERPTNRLGDVLGKHDTR
jgi:hypothetical protein